MPGGENRKHIRIEVSVPVYYTALDDQGTTLNFSMGVVRDVSQGGGALEAYSEPDSEWMSLSFVAISGNTLEIRGQSAYSRETEPEKFMTGVVLLGSSAEKLEFVKEIVRFHHYTKRSINWHPCGRGGGGGSIGSNSTPVSARTVSGAVADGYISGATVTVFNSVEMTTQIGLGTYTADGALVKRSRRS